MGGPRHKLAIDLTEHFQFAGNGKGVPKRKWERFPSSLAQNAQTALRLLERHGAKATFFVDGWIAVRYPQVIAAIARAGHEIAARDDTGEATEQTVMDLEAGCGQAVRGWRPAPGTGPRELSERAATAGLSYALCARAHTQLRSATANARFIPLGRLLSTGQELRLLPEALVPMFLLSWMQARASRVLSLAVWELDPDVPRLAIHSGTARLRSYRNLDVFEARLGRLLKSVEFTSFRESLGLPDRASLRTPAQRQTKLTGCGARPLREPVTIVVPCFNEEPGITYLFNVVRELEAGIGSLHQLSFVLVDDGSTDNTWREMQRLFAARQRCKLVRHARNRGIGAAIATGITTAEDEIVAVIDSDCSYDPARIVDMLHLLEPDVAAVTASPYHVLGGVEGVPQWRLFLSKAASALYRLVMRNKLATYTSCFRVYRKPLVEGLALRHDGYIGVVEILARLDLQGRRIVEYPVALETRLLGHSKLKTARVIAEHLRFLSEIAALRITEWQRRDIANNEVRGWR